MRIKHLLIPILIITLFGVSCTKENPGYLDEIPTQSPHYNTSSVSATGFPETFESGSKGAYAAADVVLTTGTWNLSDALIGTSTSDAKNGAKSVRIQNSGKVTMKFDVTNGATSVSVYYAKYGTDASSTFQLWTSVNGGTTWVQSGSTITASTTTLTKATFTTSFTGSVRFEIRKTGGGRLNIDDLDIQSNAGSVEDNMAMGNPSGATTNTAYPNNYLMVKTQFTLAYNNSRGTPAWVAWHISPEWDGSAARCDCFTVDNTLPSTFFKATTSNYTNTGFDRGHMCPSADRDLNAADNAATFLMTNIMPQSPNLNQITWAALETYCRTLMNAGNELYVYSGGYGTGGTGSLGGVTNTIAGGAITVPSNYWKVIVVLPQGTNDVARVTTSTRVIAVNMPNNQTVNAQTWGYYRVSVASLQSILGYNFLSNVPTSIQNVIEANADNGPTQ
jgi:endonuclease G, mitochondrial